MRSKAHSLTRSRKLISGAKVIAANPAVAAVAAVAVGLAALALVNTRLASAAERRNPPKGKFITVEGVRLHFVERGRGEPLVLLHGNGSMVEDFISSGLVTAAARSHRVIVFDRPGYGHSERPRGTLWTPDAQAHLIEAALTELGVTRAIVLGHSWGCTVAIALALRSPHLVRSLVLASGYYFPGMSVGVVALSAPAVPVFGDVLRYTMAPVLTRLTWPLLMRKIFGPRPEPSRFRRGFSKEMAVRPSQLRASAEETAMLVPWAGAYVQRYSDLAMPVIVLAGQEDKLVDTARQSARLKSSLPNASFHAVGGAGHMVHQSDPTAVMAAIEEAAAS